MSKERAFTLIEIIIAVTVFSVIILIVISIINNLTTERKVALERSKINENIILFEKKLKDMLNGSDLTITPEIVNLPSTGIDIITPTSVPTAVIYPNICDTSPTRSLVLYRRVQNRNPITNETTYESQLITVSSDNRRILFTLNNQATGTGNNPLLDLVVFTNDRTALSSFILYFGPARRNQFDNNNTIIDEIDFRTPFIDRTGRYEVALRFWRNRITNERGEIIYATSQQIIYQVAGNARNIRSLNVRIRGGNIQQIGIESLHDPISINSEIIVGVYDTRGRRRLRYNRVLNIPLKYRSII
ncbi:MAG: prepilin-type N-terminal cleavage/methylation domain-containing protein [bacterium]|nr:prepilin-type N-terminal cleavage/methylation domain-containing protein [bacterium]